MSDEQPQIPGPTPGGWLAPTPPETPAITESTVDGTTTPTLLLGANTSLHMRRFVAVYAVLGLVLVGAGVGIVMLASRPEPAPTPAWSSWRPAPDTATKMTNEIADHVAHSYHAAQGGGQLTNVIPGKPTVTSGTTKVPITVIAIRAKPKSDAGIQVLTGNDVTGSQLFTFCGLGVSCAITGGKATRVRSRLVYREALEVALYTFKFVPSVKSVLAFMPPAPGKTKSPLLLLRRENLKAQLDKPLHLTLTRQTPPLPTDPNDVEAATIDELTLPHTFDYFLQALPTGSAAVVLEPRT